jgi:hypothetical protein
VGLVDASSVSATDGNIGLRRMPEGVELKEHDILVTKKGGTSTVEHVISEDIASRLGCLLSHTQSGFRTATVEAAR